MTVLSTTVRRCHAVVVIGVGVGGGGGDSVLLSTVCCCRRCVVVVVVASAVVAVRDGVLSTTVRRCRAVCDCGL